MATSDFREKDIPKSVRQRKAIINILTYAIIAGAAFAVFALTHRDPTLTGLPYLTEVLIGLFVFVFALVSAVYVWRCPNCHKFLGFNRNIKQCQQCKTTFEDLSKNIDENDIVSSYKKRRKIVWLASIPIFLALLLCFFLQKADGVYLVIPAVLVIPAFIVMFVQWRCPNCNRYLGREMNPKRCPNCDTRLHW